MSIKQPFEYHVENIVIPYKNPHQGRRDVQTQRRHLGTRRPRLAQPSALGRGRASGSGRLGAGERSATHAGVTEIGNQNAQGWAWGVALPVSYLLFFKRATS